MSSIIIRTGVVLSGLMLLVSLGCSDARAPESSINLKTGKHMTALWKSPDAHGTAAKAAAAPNSGFAWCQDCHSDGFVGGIANLSCLNMAGCHGAGINAPHSPAPWRGGARTHSNTDQSNAPVCAMCHTNGANSSVQPSPFNPGAAPGCFNNTLCHAVVGHSTIWENPFFHGAAAKSAPGAAGFSYCQTCHGNNFTGGIALQTCLNTAGCHGANVSAPHSPKPWRGGTRTHTDTDPNNAPVCATCHTNGANSSVQPSPPAPTGTAPGCFNNTLCHAATGHAAGWALPAAHGTTAKAAPGATSGFSLCQSCHGSDFTGGTALQTCLNTAGCHGAGVNAPHAASWLPGGTYTHTTTDQGNAPVCALCHLGGRTPPSYATVPAGTQPGCFNNTLCHATPGHAAGWALPAAHGASAKAAPNVATTSGFSTCQTCHNTDFTGGIANKTCYLCHLTAPHAPAPWRGASGASTHVTTDPANATVCANCHTNGANSTRKPSPFDPGAAPGCFNNTLCHASPTCGSCHAIPPNGATVPNQAGRHAVHDALANVTGVCGTCHSGAGSGTLNHNNGTVNVAFVSTYNAKSGSAAYNAAGFTCSNVSCHGGQTTPSWLAGTINVNTQCTSCHSPGTSQYNSQNSGRHSTHASQAIACYTCHDTTLLAVNHFTHLNTTAMEGPASATLRSQLQYNGTSCNPSAGGLSGCHSSKSW